MNQNQQKPFSTEQLEFLHLSQEQALLREERGMIQRIDVTKEMLEEQRKKLQQAKAFVQQREKEKSSFLYQIKKLLGFIPNDFADAPPKTVPRSDEWVSYMIDKMIELFPDIYEEECLKALECGIKPKKSFIMHKVCFD